MMKRRSFLASTAALPLVVAGSGLRAVAGADIVSVAVVITGISAQTEPGPLATVAGMLLDRGVWVTCGITLPEHDEPHDGLHDVFDGLNQLDGGVDYALQIPQLAALSPYFQTRAVYEARMRLSRIAGDRVAALNVRSAICDEIDAPLDPMGARTAGIETVLVRPGEDGHVRSEAWDAKVVRFFGGLRLAPEAGFAFDPAAAGPEKRVLYYVSAETLQGVPEGRLTDWAETVARTLAEREASGQAALMSVPDLRLRDDFNRQRLVSVVIEADADAAEAELKTVAQFREQLQKSGIPAGVKGAGATVWASASGKSAALAPLAVDCGTAGAVKVAADAPAGPGFGLELAKPQSAAFGLDGCAVLQVPTIRLTRDSAGPDQIAKTAGAGDRVVLITADQIATPAARRIILSGLQALRGDTITRFVRLDQLAGALHTDGPVETRHRLTRSAAVRASMLPAPALANPAEREQLLDDARHAWGYFERYTERATGLCPATIDSRPGGEIHRSVTMWDVGSNINALVAAAEIGLIDKDQAIQRLKRILPNITGRRTNDRMLPQGWIRTDKFHWGDWNFDGCDTGRLLSALDHFRRRIGLSKELEKHVAAWEFDKVIQNGEIHSVTNRKLESTYMSHCAHYAALAFRRWGFAAASPYETFADREPGDGEVAMLETLARIGPLGTEPLLLEAAELGMSPESAYLAEVLLSALEEEYAETGRLLCVSETPIDRSPWFIYQGLQLGAGPRSWRLDTVGHKPQFMTEAAAEEYLAFSTKAAFLWAAYRPGAFTGRLLDFARKHGRNRTGFTSSIEVKSQRSTAGYTDLNSNSIILQAIAHRLQGR